MRHAIIDIGSNTAKAYIYGDDLKKIISRSVSLQLIKYVINGFIDDAGCDALYKSVGILNGFLRENGADGIFVIATQALRSAENADEIIEAIQQKYHISVQLLSGQDEAMCDFAAAEHFSQNKCNVVLDVGGGSSQLILADCKKPLFSQSYKLGAMELALKFGGVYPHEETYRSCCDYVRKVIGASLVGVKLNGGNKAICAMGGSITCAAALMNKNDKKTKTIFSAEELNGFAEDLVQMGERGREILENETDGREISLLYGLASVTTTADVCGCDEIEVLSCGVREGYLLINNKGQFENEKL